MSTLLKFAVATAMITATVGLSQAQQTGRSIEVLPAAGEPAQEQTVAQAPEAPAEAQEAPAAAPEAPAAEQGAPEQIAPQQAAPAPQAIPVPPAARAEQIPAKPLVKQIVKPIPAPAPKVVEKCHDEKPVYGYAPRHQEYAPRYTYAPRYEYAPRYHGGGYRGGY